MASNVDPSKRKPRWYFGGISSACAACITHPLDLVKVCYIAYFLRAKMLLLYNIINSVIK